MNAPTAPPAPAAAGRGSYPGTTIPASVELDFNSGPVNQAHRILIYGTGGIGKTTLAAYLPAVAFLDIEDGTRYLNVTRDSSIKTWETLRGKLAAIAKSPPAGVKTIVVDSGTVAEELAKAHVIERKKTDGGNPVDSIEGFGWGKGWKYVAEEFTGLLADLDRVVAQGINVCIVAHEVSTPVPNPAGEDYLRWEPHFYAGDKKQNGSIRNRVCQWVDHNLYISYDVFVKDGKGRGSGTRTIYTMEAPTHLAKSRQKQAAFDYNLNDPAAIWRELGILSATPTN